ncbi:MAG: HAMP domain-containing protein [Acidobacteria bacterium]|nr:HAMP domain-containing protein [Acidobacteriota bacterium]
MRLRSQIFLFALTIPAAILVLLVVLLPRQLEPYFTEQFATELKQEALLIRRDLEGAAHSLGEIHDYASRIGTTVERRVTIIDPEGAVIGDNSAGDARMENHNRRPEVQQARAQGLGQSVRHSDRLGTEMLYVAVPFRTPDGRTGVVRVSLPYQVIEQSREKVRRVVYWLSFLAFCGSAALAYLFSYKISRSTEAIAAAARSVASGSLEARTAVQGPPELQTLGRAFNQMTDRQVSQIQENVAERQKLRTILEGMQEGVLMIDPQGKVEFINPACCRMLDLQHAVEGRGIIEVVRQLELEAALRAVLLKKESQQLEVELHRSRRTALVTLCPVLYQEAVRGVVIVLQDVTWLRKLENARKEFVANVSHELRTPLTSIQGYTETLLEGSVLDEQTRRSFLSVIHRHAERLSRLIEDLLQLSFLESGTGRLERVSVNAAETARSTCRSMRSLFESKNISCSIQAASGTEVLAHPGALEQVFYNLLDNAAKYTPEGGTVRVEIEREGESVRVAIRDTGIGIPPEDLPRIFERFYRADKSRSREMGGTGLGLAIVKHILQLHGGSIRVDSRVNEGSTFTFQLPAA